MKVKLSVAQKQVAIYTPFIKLDELLKFASAVLSGGEAKEVIQGGKVEYNGEICTMRGKKVYPGDKVKYGGVVYEVVSQ
ncbi:MAG: RNA-binding S4 domain-containing protein [Clostridia bacterium]|nr:RNA-binding S4 domain-containing protein [Clostridia bacterium]